MVNYILSIVILTMNRKEQLLEALDSCFAAKLPENTEFVIVDNHSTDGTGEAIKAYMAAHEDVRFRYEYEMENLGVGGGRARGFDLAEGKYLYFLDDDAVISEESRETFFMETIEYLERNRKVATITTCIQDAVLKNNRELEQSKCQIEGRNLVFKYLGGSHFLRKAAFESPLYFAVKYGSEEYAPSIIAQDKGYYHVYFENVYIIHKPKVNKWIDGTESMEFVLRCGCAVTYATKKILYPAVFSPVLYLVYRMRCYKYLRLYPDSIKKCDSMVKDIVKNNRYAKVRFSTVIELYKKFGLTVF